MTGPTCNDGEHSDGIKSIRATAAGIWRVQLANIQIWVAVIAARANSLRMAKTLRLNLASEESHGARTKRQQNPAIASLS
ncbi:hypothetical protein ColTof3_04640 [Colletotrichum tofieldiae]|nr:hypothetical protein ColTof3_04640 [Colletotrichum tofieldiae]GKT86855.1 hypothetical protein Ct61P_04705 [Colletotrichum tofieldiae]